MKKCLKKQRLFGIVMLAALGISLFAPGEKMNVVKAADITIDETTFPDSVFQDYVRNNFDKDSNGILSDTERANVKEIFVGNKGISDLKGIEYFPNLLYLHCEKNNLTSLDTSSNPLVRSIFCFNNALTSINVSNNPALDTLWCSGNSLTSLDVTGNPALQDLSCYNNKLTALDVSNCTALTELSCYNNKLESLDVSNNTALIHLNCRVNHIASLDVSHNTLLEQCDMTYNWMYTMDFSNNAALSDIYVPRIYTTGNASVKAYRYGDEDFYIDLNELNLDLSRVSYSAESFNGNVGTYDAKTGRINFTYNSSNLRGKSFVYIYDTKAPNVKYKDLQVFINVSDIVDVRDPKKPTTEETTTEAPTTETPTTETPTTEAPTTEAPTTEAPTTEIQTTETPATEAPATTQNIAGNNVQTPKTGDKAPVYILLVISFMSLAAIAVLCKLKGHRQ